MVTEQDQYLVWSNEHRAWWRASSAGYTKSTKSAGKYTRYDAMSICANARDGWRTACSDGVPSEIPVRYSDVAELENA